MELSMINFLKEDVRLVKYDNHIYKLKILFEENQKLAHFVPKFSQKEAHHELKQVILAVLCGIDKNQNLNKIQTDKFVVNVKTKPWGTSQKLGFRQDGVEVASYPFMIILNVLIKDLNKDDISSDEEICVENQTSKLNSSRNLKNTSRPTAVNSNVRDSQKRFPSAKSNTKTPKKAPPHSQQPKENVSSTNIEATANIEDILSTQDICELLDEAQQLTEVEKLEAVQKERKERKAKEDLERFALKYAQKVVKGTEKTKKLTKTKIYNVPPNIVSTPVKNTHNTTGNKNTHNTTGNLNNQKEASDSLLISESCSPKKNISQIQSQEDQRLVSCLEAVTQNSGTSANKSCELPELINRKRKLSESPQTQQSQAEDFAEKHGRGRPRKLRKKAAQKTKALRRNMRSSEEREKRQLQLHQIRKSPRIQKKVSEEKWLNKNNSAQNSVINVNKLRSTRRDRHLIEQDELAEDMKLQQLAKSSPKLKHRTSSRIKQQSSTLWDYIVSPVKSIFS